MARNAPEPPEPDEMKRSAREVRGNGDIDEQVEESFPASDAPSYAGGGVYVGCPRRVRTDRARWRLKERD